MNVIQPTVGRKVWFRPNGCDKSIVPVPGGASTKQLNIFSSDQPLDATVVCVWGDRMVNLLVVDHGGETHTFRSVTLRQPGDEVPVGPYAEWVPYQVGQAKAV